MNYCFTQLHYTRDGEIETYTSMDSINRLEKACKEAIDAIASIRAKLYKQTQKISVMDIKKTVCIERYKERPRVIIDVYVKEERILSDFTYSGRVFNTTKQFKGNEKKQALAYADELSRNYNIYTITKENWI